MGDGDFQRRRRLSLRGADVRSVPIDGYPGALETQIKLYNISESQTHELQPWLTYWGAAELLQGGRPWATHMLR